MGIEVHRQFFDSKEQVLEDLKKTGFWPTTFVSTTSPELPLHWHDSDINGYVMEGRTYVLDGETGERLEICAGDKLVIAKGTLHAEGETTGRMVYIVALPEARPFDQFLRMRSPDELKDPTADPRV